MIFEMVIQLNIASALWHYVASDYHSFFLAFPENFRLMFFLLRVVPLGLSLGYLYYAIRNYKAAQANSFSFSYPRHSNWLVALLFLLGFFIRLYFAATNDPITYGTDAASRFMQAREWYHQPNEIPGGLIWLPLYHLLILLFVPFGFDVALSGTISVLLFSALSIPLFYVVVRKLFGTAVAFWSALLLAINPFHSLYSSLYLSENLFLFFALAAFLSLLLYLESGKKRYLLLSALFVNGTTMLRYEGWILAGLFPFYLFVKRKNLALCAPYFFAGCLCILMYCWHSTQFRGVLIFGLYVSDLDVKAELASKPDKWIHIVRNLTSELIFPVWFYMLLAAGIVHAFYKRIRLSYAFIWLVLFSFTAYKVITFTSQPFWRYFATALLMLIPYGAWWLAELSKSNRNLFVAGVLLVTALHFQPLMNAYTHRKDLSRAPVAYKQACNLLREIRQPHEKVMATVAIAGMDNASFTEDAAVPQSHIYQPMPAWAKVFSNYEQCSDSTLLAKLNDTAYHYMFIQKGLVIDSVLYSPVIAQKLSETQIRLDTLFNEKDFQLLKINRH